MHLFRTFVRVGSFQVTLFFTSLFLIISSGPLFSEEASCTVYFSPKDSVAEQLIRMIDQENKSIKVAIYTITHAKIIQALKRAHERGVNVEVVVDPTSIKARTPLLQLVKNQVPIFVWDPPPTIGKSGKAKKALMHDKFCIFGEERVWTGSFNFTYAAERWNAENALLIESSSVARKYLEQFHEIKIRNCRTFEHFQALYGKKKSG